MIGRSVRKLENGPNSTQWLRRRLLSLYSSMKPPAAYLCSQVKACLMHHRPLMDRYSIAEMH